MDMVTITRKQYDADIAEAKASALREAAAAIRNEDERCTVKRTCHYADALTLEARAASIEAGL